MAKPKPKQDVPKTPSNAEMLAGLPDKITQLLAQESDRGAILIVAAYLEEILALLISVSTVSAASAKPLLSLSGPCGTFESKILIAQAFGLLHESDAKPLRLIQQIRNKAAHFDSKQGRGFDVLFDAPATIERVEELAHLNHVEVLGHTAVEIRAAFIKSARLVSARLTLLAAIAKPAKPILSQEEFITKTAENMRRDVPAFQQLTEHLFTQTADGRIDFLGQMLKLVQRKEGIEPSEAQLRAEMMLKEAVAMMRVNIGELLDDKGSDLASKQ